MFDDRPKADLLRRFTQEDLAAKTIRTGLSLIPGGGLLAELLTEFIPAQRLDRLHDFAEQLAARLQGLEDAFHSRVKESAAYGSLAEQATLSAVRSASSQRRKDLAEILRTGLTLDEAATIEHEALLRLLDRLNDAEIIVLMRHGSFRQTLNNPELAAFDAEHPGVLGVEPPTLADSDEVIRRWTMRQHYEAELVALGLLRDAEGIVKSRGWRRLEITDLGRILLRSIGRPVAE